MQKQFMIRIETLTSTTLDEVFELEQICFPDDPWGKMSFENELDNPRSVFLVAIDEEKNKVVAYGGVWIVYDMGEITNIAVHPDYRREGIGKNILKLLTDICRENNMLGITLEVRESNTGAKALYQNEGFVVCGLRKRYYQGIEDAIIMTKEFEKEAE